MKQDGTQDITNDYGDPPPDRGLSQRAGINGARNLTESGKPIQELNSMHAIVNVGNNINSDLIDYILQTDSPNNQEGPRQGIGAEIAAADDTTGQPSDVTFKEPSNAFHSSMTNPIYVDFRGFNTFTNEVNLVGTRYFIHFLPLDGKDDPWSPYVFNVGNIAWYQTFKGIDDSKEDMTSDIMDIIRHSTSTTDGSGDTASTDGKQMICHIKSIKSYANQTQEMGSFSTVGIPVYLAGSLSQNTSTGNLYSSDNKQKISQRSNAQSVDLTGEVNNSPINFTVKSTRSSPRTIGNDGDGTQIVL